MGNCLLSIGGAGHRSLKPLVFLAAAGVLGDEDLSILCVDNDSTNGNLNESLNLIHLYNRVQTGTRWLGDSAFFRPKLTLVDDKPWSPFDATGGDPTLDHYLGHESMRASEEELTTLYEFLYDSEKRKLEVTEGFRGKPSIGAAVYRAAARAKTNGTVDSLQRLRVLLETGAAQGKPVKLFSVGSICGGTGAAGLPSIPLSLIERMKNGGEHVLSGAAFLLPYFNFDTNALEDQGAHANPNDFIMMMKDALRYYLLNPSGYHCVYAIGADNWRHIATPAVGKKEQKNQADLVEFLAALAASNFLVSWQPPDATTKTEQPELYVLHRGEGAAFNWSDIPEAERIKPKMASFTRFAFLYLSDFAPLLEKSASKPIDQVWFKNLVQDAGVNPASAQFQEQVAALKAFCTEYLQWWDHLHQGAATGLKLVQSSAFAGGRFDRNAFPSLVVGERYPASRDQAVKQLHGERREQKSDLSGLGYFAQALERVTRSSNYATNVAGR